jgi:peptide/nickel transport system substrate-binding protein
MNRRTFLGVVGTGAAAGLAGCSSSGNDDARAGETDGTGSTGDTETNGTENAGNGKKSSEFPVTITQGSMKWTLDPHNHRTTSTTNVLLHAYEGLLTRNAKGKVAEELATNYERVEDGTVKFTIRKGVTFHNGDELTPEDVAYSINRIVDDDVGIVSSQSGELTGVTGASVVDGEHAVEVNSDGVNPLVFSLFATYCDIVQKSWTEGRKKSEVAKGINGTGPFKLDKYVEDTRVVFTRYEDYWGEAPEPTRLTFETAGESSTRVNQLLNGETDIIDNVPPQEVARIKGSDSARVSAVPSTRIIFNAMRDDREPFSSPKFRQAMNYAIDLDSIVKNVLSNFGDTTNQPTLEGFTGHDPSVKDYPHNPNKAERLVEESGHTGVEITLHTPVGRYLKDTEIAQAVAEQISRLPNVDCSAKQRDFGALGGSISDGDASTGPAFYLLGWGNPTFDASQTIIPHLTSDGALSSYSNPEVDDLIAKAQSKSDANARKKLLRKANRILHDEAPWLFLNRQYSVYGASGRLNWEPRRDERIDATGITRQ